MHSRIVLGKVTHGRLETVAHAFTYPVYYYCLDLDELESLPKKLVLFGYNKIRPVSIFDCDYLDGGDEPLKSKVLRWLRSHGCDREVSRIELVTAPRFFNYVFNPVSFYFCYGVDGVVIYHIAEVNNTYKERHPYVLGGPGAQPTGASNNSIIHYSITREFFVSPFNQIVGDYDISFGNLKQSLDVKFNIREGDKVQFVSRMWGNFLPLTTWNQTKVILTYPITALLTMPRILWQAQKLRFFKKLPMLDKPHPLSSETIALQKKEDWL